MRPGTGASLLVALALLAAGCGGGTTTVVVTSTASPSATTSSVGSSTQGTTASSSTLTATTSSSTTTAAAAARIVHVATFKSPSSNIGCMIIAGTARCDIKQKSWSLPPRPSSCPKIVDFGQGLIVTGSGPGHLVCAGDTVLDPTAKVLPYNADTVVGAFRCESRTSGMTCTNTSTGHGFFLSIQSYRAF